MFAPNENFRKVKRNIRANQRNLVKYFNINFSLIKKHFHVLLTFTILRKQLSTDKSPTTLNETSSTDLKLSLFQTVRIADITNLTLAKKIKKVSPHKY